MANNTSVDSNEYQTDKFEPNDDDYDDEKFETSIDAQNEEIKKKK